MSASLLAEIEKGTKNALVKKRIIAFHISVKSPFIPIKHFSTSGHKICPLLLSTEKQKSPARSHTVLTNDI